MINLKKIRIEKGLSLTELSKLAECPWSTLKDIEVKNNTTTNTAKKIAIALNVSLDELCFTDEELQNLSNKKQ